VLTATLVLLLTLSSIGVASAAGRRARVFEMVNHFRRAHGLVAVHEVADVDLMARRHSRRMASAGTLFHTSDLQQRLSSKDATMWGEIIGQKKTVRATVHAWINSPPHRSIMLTSGYRRAGVGLVRARGFLWVTMIFYR
jgi:uncharacterized protein YkwD